MASRGIENWMHLFHCAAYLGILSAGFDLNKAGLFSLSIFPSIHYLGNGPVESVWQVLIYTASQGNIVHWYRKARWLAS